MHIAKEQKILRLHIEFTNTPADRAVALEWLDDRFGEYGYRIRQAGAKPLNDGETHPTLGLIVAEVEQ